MGVDCQEYRFDGQLITNIPQSSLELEIWNDLAVCTPVQSGEVLSGIGAYRLAGKVRVYQVTGLMAGDSLGLRVWHGITTLSVGAVVGLSGA